MLIMDARVKPGHDGGRKNPHPGALRAPTLPTRGRVKKDYYIQTAD